MTTAPKVALVTGATQGLGLALAEGLARRLDAYYRSQAAHYDAFRLRLLHGRGPLLDALAPSPGERVLDLGAGTAFLWELAGPRRRRTVRLGGV